MIRILLVLGVLPYILNKFLRLAPQIIFLPDHVKIDALQFRRINFGNTFYKDTKMFISGDKVFDFPTLANWVEWFLRNDILKIL